ncbi:hypothetical protein BKA81DRAFT_432092 [Phyllosticta paracitricarpa]|uniref:DNA-binding protein REB1 n=1 Tax=Phyllosticta paracitricarpa TaxID=2016321 RepID=A0ABR1NHB3_9PEZI
MGQGSSQLDADAPITLDAPASSGLSAMSGQEDDMAASSQLASEELTSKHRPKNKDKKKKSSKRKSEGSVKDQETSPLTNGHGKNVEAPTRNLARAESHAVRESKDTTAGQDAAEDAKENVKKSKKKSAKAAEAESPVDVAHGKSSKKRKRKSKDAADLDEKAQPDVEPASADFTQTPNRLENEEKPAKKMKNCKRLSKSGVFPTPVKETPIPLPIALPISPEDSKDQTPSKSKKKARGADADEQHDKENAVRTAFPETNDAKLEDTQELEDGSSKRHKKHKKDKREKREKKGKKEKRSRHSDALQTQESSGSQETPSTDPRNIEPQTVSSRLPAADDSMIDPALLPPSGTQEERQVNGWDEEQPHKKSKKSKSSRRSEKTETRNKEEAVRKAAEQTYKEKPKIGLFDTSDAHERTGQTAYIEHQKKKEKRKRKSEQANASADGTQEVPSTAPEPIQESRTKKRKTKASETDAEQQTTSKGQKGSFGDSEDFPSSGPYTKKEIETLTRAIETYRDFYDLTQRQVNDIVQAGVFAEVHNKSCKAFWDDICPCLPNRWSRETIIKFVRRKWHNYEKRGKWDPEEDDMLREAYARFPGQWTNIGSELGRFPDDCRDRWRNYLSCSDTMSTKRWHDSEVNELLNIVQECLNSLLERLPEDQQQRWREELQCTEPRKIWMPKEIQNLVRKMPICMEALRAAFSQKHPRNTGQKRASDRRRGSSDTDSSVVINWDLVSEKMGKKRSRLQIMSKWKALENMYTGELKDSFFTEANHWRVENGQKWADNMLPGDKYNIVLAMQDLGLTNEERIVWNTVAYHDLVRLRWAHQAKMTWLLMKSLVPPQDSLPKTLDALKKYYEKNHAGELDKHWHKPRKGSKSATQSREASEAATNGNGTGELEWRGGVKFPKATKSAAWVSNEDDEDEDGAQ